MFILVVLNLGQLIWLQLDTIPCICWKFFNGDSYFNIWCINYYGGNKLDREEHSSSIETHCYEFHMSLFGLCYDLSFPGFVLFNLYCNITDSIHCFIGIMYYLICMQLVVCCGTCFSLSYFCLCSLQKYGLKFRQFHLLEMSLVWSVLMVVFRFSARCKGLFCKCLSADELYVIVNWCWLTVTILFHWGFTCLYIYVVDVVLL